jgi:hypothetical protein
LDLVFLNFIASDSISPAVREELTFCRVLVSFPKDEREFVVWNARVRTQPKLDVLELESNELVIAAVGKKNQWNECEGGDKANRVQRVKAVVTKALK